MSRRSEQKKTFYYNVKIQVGACDIYWKYKTDWYKLYKDLQYSNYQYQLIVKKNCLSIL